jgi:hypothetical protein
MSRFANGGKSFHQREAMALSARVWLSARQSQTARLEEGFSDFIKSERMLEEIANERIYSRKDVDALDLRFHQCEIAAFISEAQQIIINALLLRAEGVEPEDFFESEIAVLDKHIARLMARLNEWHGTIDTQTDIPDSLKKAFQEASSDDLIPFPEI